MMSLNEHITNFCGTTLLTIISIVPSLVNAAQYFDIFLTIMLHLLQAFAAIMAILIGYKTWKKGRYDKRNKGV